MVSPLWPICCINCVFIKNVVAVAAYSRLASRSQAKFHTMKLSPLVGPWAATPAQSTTSANRSLQFSPHSCERTWVQFTHCPSGLPRRLSNTKKEDSCGCPWRLVSWSQVERWASRLACEVVFIYVFVKPYLRGQNGGAITWPVVFSWIPAQVSRLFSFPKE